MTEYEPESRPAGFSIGNLALSRSWESEQHVHMAPWKKAILVGK